MTLTSFYPVLLVDDVAPGSRFAIEHLGFRETFRSDWYVSLVHADRPEYELAFVQRTHASVPATRRSATNVLLNVEVADASAAYEALRAAGVTLLLPLRDEPWGQRHFIAEAPGGLLLDVIELIAPSDEYAAQYVADDSGSDARSD